VLLDKEFFFVRTRALGRSTSKIVILSLLTRVSKKRLQIHCRQNVCMYFNFNVAAHNDDNERRRQKCQLQYVANKNVQQAHLNQHLCKTHIDLA